MKKIYSILTIAVLLVLIFCFPVSAAQTYSAIHKDYYVFDSIGLLSYEEWEELEVRAKTLSQHGQCGIYFAFVDDYTKYGDGDIFDVTRQIYNNGQLGVGEDRDGIIVLLSMAERDYAMFVYGEYAKYTFDSYGQERLEETFLEELKNNDWYSGISHYLDACEEYLTKAENGKPLRRPYWILVVIMTGVSCLGAAGVCFLLIRNMKTVHQKVEANEYITASGLCLTKQYDRYTHTTETRTKIEKKDSSGSSGTRRENGGSGKF